MSTEIKVKLTLAIAGQGDVVNATQSVQQAFAKLDDEVRTNTAAARALAQASEAASNQLTTSTAAAQAEARAQREAAQAKQTLATAQASFLAGLRDQIATNGKSTEELLRYRAAQLGVGQEASGLILQFQNQRAAQAAAAAAAQAEAQAQREVAQTKQAQANAQASFLAGLRDQIATTGKSTEELLRYRAAQLGVGQDASSLILQFQNQRAAQAAAAAAAQAEAQAQREAAQAKQAQANAQASFLAGLRDQVAVQGMTTAETMRYRAAQLGVSKDAGSLIDALAAANKGHGVGSVSAAQHAQALRMLPTQFTDIATSVASGMPIWMVAVQQGGQIKDSFGGAGVAARELGRYVLGLANPFTLTAVATAVMAAGSYAGAQESRALQSAIINSGNAAGVTTGQLMGMAAGVDDLVGTQGRAVEVLSAFVATGKVGAANMQDFTTAAIRFESVGGAAAEDTVKAFAELGKSPVEASLKLNESMGYLTVSTYQQIKALADQGRHTEAAEIAQRAFADTLNARAGQMEANLGLVEKGWYGIKKAVAEAWDAIKSIGRDAGPEGRLETLGKSIAQLEANIAARKRDGHAVPERDAMLERLRNEQALLQKQVGYRQAQSTEQAKQVQLAKDFAEWEKRGESFRSDQQKLNAAIQKERQTSQGLINAGILTEQQLAERINAIRDEYSKKSGKATGNSELANITARVAAEQRNLELLRTQGVYADKLNDGQRMALQLSEQLTGKLDARTRASKEAQLIQAKLLSDVFQQQDAEREMAQAKAAAAALDDKLTSQQLGQVQQSIDQLINGNEQLRVEIDLVGRDTAARREYLAVKAQEVINAKELEVINLRNSGARQELIDKAEQELRLLRDKAALTVTAAGKQDGQAAKDMLDAIQRETAALSMSNVERQVAIALLELEAKGIKNGTDAYDEYIPKIRAAIANKAALEQSIASWESIESTAHSVWTSVADDGVDAFERVGKTLKASVLDALWQMTGRQWLISIGNAVGVPGAAAAGQASAGGSIGSRLLSNAASSYASSALGATVFGNSAAYGAALGTTSIGAGSQAAMLAAQTGEFGLAGLSATSSAAGGAMSGVMAAAPYLSAVVAIAALAKSLDDSGTYHTGGLGSYSAAQGSAVGDAVKTQGLGFGLANDSYQDSTEQVSVAMAQTIVGLLDSTATAFGQQAGYWAATGFADDTSKDGAWGALAIKMGDTLLADWKDGADRWPGREFANGEEGAKQYAAAVAVDVRDLLLKQTPEWADTMLTALGDAPSIEQLAATVGQINTVVRVLDNLGRSATSFAALGDAATGALIRQLGGAEAAVSALDAYHANYFTAAEKTALVTGQLTEQLADMGLQLPATREAWRAMIDSALGSGDTETAAKLVQLSTAFATLTQSTDDLDTAAASAAESVTAVFAALQKSITDVLTATTADRAAINGTATPTLESLQDGIRRVSGAGVSDVALIAAKAGVAAADTTAAQLKAAAVPYRTAAADATRLMNEDLATAAWHVNWRDADLLPQRADLLDNRNTPDKWRLLGVVDADIARANQTIASANTDALANSLAASLNTAIADGLVAKADSTTSDAAAALVAAENDYITSTAAWVEGAKVSVQALEDLRRKTIDYHAAQKELAQTMATSAATLRSAVHATRLDVMDAGASLHARVADYDRSYVMALSSTGATKAEYGDKLAAELPGLARDSAAQHSTRADWEMLVAQLTAKADTVAGQLESAAPTNYQAQANELLDAIDTKLAAINDASKSAEAVISEAIEAGSNRTAEGLKQIVLQLQGKSATTAFAKGGVFTNQIVNTPTLAPMALFGEVGDEAIMPLTRGPGGVLGVAAFGAKDGRSDAASERLHRDMLGVMQAQAQRINLLERELAGLRTDNNIGNSRIFTATDKTARILERWEVVGMPKVRA